MNPTTPCVTVLVPSFNHSAYIGQRIRSIMEQTYQDFELIVIDDCSSDNSDSVITSLQREFSFKYIRNPKNSGTPFSAWETVLQLAQGKFIWICESDDYAAPHFLETAVNSMLKDRSASVFYCDSWIVDSTGKHIGHTDEYFHEIWKETRWDTSFSNDGVAELEEFQIRGQTVPNMSSALISTDAFRRSFTPVLKKFKLTGDWLFIGLLFKEGSVIHARQTLSHFRKHEVTSRARVKSARSQAEFILTKYLLFRATNASFRDFAPVMGTDAIRFLYESAKLTEVIRAAMQVSLSITLRATLLLGASLATNPHYLKKFYLRYKQAKGGV